MAPLMAGPTGRERCNRDAGVVMLDIQLLAMRPIAYAVGWHHWEIQLPNEGTWLIADQRRTHGA